MTRLPRPFYRWTTYEGHGGIDYPYPRGTLVPASGPGVIDFDGYYSERGGFAKFITYDCGCRHGYYHFDSKWGMTVGERVEYGTLFARIGGLGQYSTGPHLHHEVWDGQTSIIKPPDYWEYVDADSYVGDGRTASNTSKPFEEDDMFTDDDRAKLTAVYAALFGPANVGASELKWNSVDGPRKGRYGLLDIDARTQQLAAEAARDSAAVLKLGEDS